MRKPIRYWIRYHGFIIGSSKTKAIAKRRVDRMLAKLRNDIAQREGAAVGYDYTVTRGQFGKCVYTRIGYA